MCDDPEMVALSTTAKRKSDATYSIQGSKIFISAGDHDLCDNIIHPVLARIEGAPTGTKGISLFLVPKYHVSEDGSLGDFNHVSCTGLEHNTLLPATLGKMDAISDADSSVEDIQDLSFGSY